MVTGRGLRTNELAADALVVALGVIVGDELGEQVTKMSLPEDHEMVQALGPYRSHDPFRVRVAVWALRGNRHTLDSAGLEKCCPHLCEQRVPVMDQVGRLAEEAVHRLEQVTGSRSTSPT